MSGLTVSFLKSYSANNGYSNSIHLEVYNYIIIKSKNKIQKTIKMIKLNIHNNNVLNSLQQLSSSIVNAFERLTYPVVFHFFNPFSILKKKGKFDPWPFLYDLNFLLFDLEWHGFGVLLLVFLFVHLVIVCIDIIRHFLPSRLPLLFGLTLCGGTRARFGQLSKEAKP